MTTSHPIFEELEPVAGTTTTKCNFVRTKCLAHYRHYGSFWQNFFGPVMAQLGLSRTHYVDQLRSTDNIHKAGWLLDDNVWRQFSDNGFQPPHLEVVIAHPCIDRRVKMFNGHG